MKKENVITIDGPAGSGKTEIAGRISRKLKIPYVNTGNMYRAIAKLALDANIKKEDFSSNTLMPILQNTSMEYKYLPASGENNGENKSDCMLIVNGQDISDGLHTPLISQAASIAASIPEVRTWLINKQRKIASLGMIVMEGRDIGTVIFPNAKYKFFLTASPLVRAKRRLIQLGEELTPENIKHTIDEIKQRDIRDMTREIAPLKQAEDAVSINTDNLSIDNVLSIILQHVKNII